MELAVSFYFNPGLVPPSDGNHPPRACVRAPMGLALSTPRGRWLRRKELPVIMDFLAPVGYLGLLLAAWAAESPEG